MASAAERAGDGPRVEVCRPAACDADDLPLHLDEADGGSESVRSTSRCTRFDTPSTYSGQERATISSSTAADASRLDSLQHLLEEGAIPVPSGVADSGAELSWRHRDAGTRTAPRRHGAWSSST